MVAHVREHQPDPTSTLSSLSILWALADYSTWDNAVLKLQILKAQSQCLRGL